MTPGEWIALIALVLSICGAATVVAMRIGRLEGKLENGPMAGIQRLEDKWDDLPCARHDAMLSQIKRMLETKDDSVRNGDGG